MTFRIKETIEGERSSFMVQRKCLWWWHDEWSPYGNTVYGETPLQQCKSHIDSVLKNEQARKERRVEYIKYP